MKKLRPSHPYKPARASTLSPRRRENARLLRATAVACVVAAVATSLAVVNAPPGPTREGAVAGEVSVVGGVGRVQDLRLAEEQPYRDPARRFRIDFPAGWEVRPRGEGGGVEATRAGATIAVMVQDAATPDMVRRVREDFGKRGIRLSDPDALRAVRAELDFARFPQEQVGDFVERRLRKIRALAAGSQVEEEGLRELAGRRAGYLRAVSRAGGAESEVVNVLYFTLHRGKYYHVAAGALATDFESLAPLLQRSIASFDIMEQ